MFVGVLHTPGELAQVLSAKLQHAVVQHPTRTNGRHGKCVVTSKKGSQELTLTRVTSASAVMRLSSSVAPKAARAASLAAEMSSNCLAFAREFAKSTSATLSAALKARKVFNLSS
jgi:hypothetical protein